MNKGEFLYNLRTNLAALPKDEIEAIIQEYSVHIDEQLEEGKKIDEILLSLGNPKDIANEHLEELEEFKEEIRKEVPTNKEEDFRRTQRNDNNINFNSNKNVPLFVVMQFINFFILFWTLFGISIAVISIGFSGLTVFGVSFFVLLRTREEFLVRIFQFFVMVGVGTLLFNAALAIGIALVKLLTKYAKWNMSLIS